MPRKYLNGIDTLSHQHEIIQTTGNLPVSRGGTGSTTAAAARSALGIPSDPVATSAGMRTLGYSATSAYPGNAFPLSKTMSQEASGNWSSTAAIRTFSYTIPATPYGTGVAYTLRMFASITAYIPSGQWYNHFIKVNGNLLYPVLPFVNGYSSSIDVPSVSINEMFILNPANPVTVEFFYQCSTSSTSNIRVGNAIINIMPGGLLP